ncbi:unnamed protein product, partial [Prorocentrum cordatum]
MPAAAGGRDGPPATSGSEAGVWFIRHHRCEGRSQGRRRLLALAAAAAAPLRAAAAGWQGCGLQNLLERHLAYVDHSGAEMRTYAERNPLWRAEMLSAAAYQRNCTRRVGGRYWIATTRFLDNFTDAWSGESMGTHLGFSRGDGSAINGMCVPAPCSELRVREVMVPLLWYLRLFGSIRDITMPEAAMRFKLNMQDRPEVVDKIFKDELPQVRRLLDVEVEEASSWSELDVSWAILGFAGSGTSTLAWNLHQHPELELLYDPAQMSVGEEHFFLYDRTSHLPNQREVFEFNAQRRKPGHQRLLRGVKRPSYIESPAALARLAQIPGLIGIAH